VQELLPGSLPWMPHEIRLSSTRRYLVAANQTDYVLLDLTAEGAQVRAGSGWPAVAFSGEDHSFAVIEDQAGGRLLRWLELPSGRELAAWSDAAWQNREAMSVQFWPDEKRLLVSNSAELGLWDCEGGTWERQSRHYKNAMMCSVAGMNQFALAIADQIFLVDRRLEVVRQLQQQRGGVTSMQWSPDHRTLVTGHEGGIACFWHAATGMQLFELAAHQFRPTQLAFSRDGTDLFTIGQRHIATERPNFDLLRWEAPQPKPANH